MKCTNISIRVFPLFLLTILCFSFFSLKAFSSYPKRLIFEGAGIKGLAYAGAIKYMEENELLDSITHVGGTSAGAITALLIALQYSATEISEIISETNFQKFKEGGWIFIGGISRMSKSYGWYKGERFTNWLHDLIEHKTGNGDVTFEELSEKGFPELFFTSTCINKQILVILSKNTYPRMKIKDAVRISMSIPLYYRAVFIDKDGKVYKRAKNGTNLDIMVDGGISGNFPINIFDEKDNMGKIIKVNDQTLGFRIDNKEQIKNDLSDHELAEFEVNSFKEYMIAFYTYTIENLNRQTLTEKDWDRTISISSEGMGPKVKRISQEQKQLLLKSGYTAAEKYFEKPSQQ